MDGFVALCRARLSREDEETICGWTVLVPFSLDETIRLPLGSGYTETSTVVAGALQVLAIAERPTAAVGLPAETPHMCDNLDLTVWFGEGAAERLVAARPGPWSDDLDTATDRATVGATQTDPNSGNNTATATTTVDNARGCTRIGTSGNDTITGTSGNDVICALGGDDTVDAGFGDDTVHGGYGNDRLDGGSGNDTLTAGPGNDNLIGNSGTDNLNTVDNVSGNDTANGGPQTDTCTTDTGDTRLSRP
ncbi:calcium-binding protein [Streptomyces sp. NBC_00151]|uniref:calcium-binding protein n=1 Tax=Streptomyces sp. NBC_00151 TaxID=2975669 RepID=UPI002DD8FCB6|nr:hypothetical protein [Streptomyces sp. NBC_00151]WRZ37118.1 hypothetical protein OG915_03020 [Streptomyces sp. NBC_00151]